MGNIFGKKAAAAAAVGAVSAAARPGAKAKKPGAKAEKPGAKAEKPGAKAKKTKKAKKAKNPKSSYEEEPEQFSNWGMALSPAAYMAVTGKEKYETDEEYEEEEYETRHQVYTPAEFANMVTPLNLSVVLMIMLLVLIILSRR